MTTLAPLQNCPLVSLVLNSPIFHEHGSLSHLVHLTYVGLGGQGQQTMAEISASPFPQSLPRIQALTGLSRLRILQVIVDRSVWGSIVIGTAFQRLISGLMPWLHWNQWHSGRSP